jgi:hypothetical protein
MKHPEYMQLAIGILDDYGLVATLEEAHGLDEEEAEHDRDMIAREIRDAMADARQDGAAVLGGLVGMGLAIRDRYEELSEWQMGYIEGAAEGEKSQRELEDFIAEKIFPVAERIRIHRSFR